MRHIFILSLAALAAGCSSGSGMLTGDGGPLAKRNFDVGAFDAVAVQGSDTVKVVTGPVAGVVATGPQKLLDALDVRVERGTLRIGHTSSMWNVGNSGSVEITVTTPGIRQASLAGSGNISIDRARGDNFDANLGGSGDLTIADMQVGKAGFSLAGSGDMTVKGTAGDAAYSIAGSGNVDASRLAAQTANISIVGSGNVKAGVRGKAKISLLGSGDAEVKGTRDCDVSKIGSGEARCTP